jgi:hypothetical protein
MGCPIAPIDLLGAFGVGSAGMEVLRNVLGDLFGRLLFRVLRSVPTPAVLATFPSPGNVAVGRVFSRAAHGSLQPGVSFDVPEIV